MLNAGASQTLTRDVHANRHVAIRQRSRYDHPRRAKATPTVSVSSAQHIYDGPPHPAAATATGVNGAVLGPVTFTYNGSRTAPVNAGTYDVVATFAGDVNYNAVINDLHGHDRQSHGHR